MQICILMVKVKKNRSTITSYDFKNQIHDFGDANKFYHIAALF